MHGHLTLWGAKQLRAEKLFCGVEALSVNHGITHGQLMEVSSDQALINSVTQIIILTDHTKFGKVSPAFIVSLEKIDTIVTSQEADKEFIENLREREINVIQA